MSDDALIMPWVIFTVHNGYYAIHSRYVTGITTPPDKLVLIPDAPDIYKGIADVHGEKYPYLDMRRLFKLESMKEGCDNWVATLERHKQAHINWANELKSSVRANVKFRLSVDPHECEFGRWFDKFSAREENSKSVLLKIGEPHRLAHEAAKKILSYIDEPDSPSRTTAIKELMFAITDEYMPEIVSIIDDTCRQIIFESRETMILLNNGAEHLALAVDRVVAVDQLSKANGKDNMMKILNSPYFADMGVSDKIKGGILIADDSKLLEKAMNDNILSMADDLAESPAAVGL